VGVVAPASGVKQEPLEAGCRRLERMGYKTCYLPSIFEEDSFFAGPVKRRARELEEMFVRDDIRAIVCARGGYGSNYLLEALDWSKLRKHPKIFVGYSDLTTLMTELMRRCNMVCLHGPMVSKDLAAEDGVDEASWYAALSGLKSWELRAGTGLIEGEAEGRLCGGCLSLLAASLGTPYEIETRGTLLFMEDVNAKPFQIDRMLMQLRLAGKLKGVNGLIFGEMKDCEQAGEDLNLQQVIKRATYDLRVPVAFGLRSGHVSRANMTLPLGVRARLSAGVGAKLSILEAATSA